MPKPFLLSRPVPAAVFILAAVILDQVLKYLVEIRLPLQQAVPLIPHLALYRTWNEGVAFSFLSGMSAWTIVGMRFVIVAFILWWWSNARQAAGLVHLGFAMIVAGAIGNIIDRFIYGHVVDYILFYTETWSFAVFNLADSLITTGAVVVGFSEFFLRRNGTKDAN